MHILYTKQTLFWLQLRMMTLVMKFCLFFFIKIPIDRIECIFSFDLTRLAFHFIDHVLDGTLLIRCVRFCCRCCCYGKYASNGDDYIMHVIALVFRIHDLKLSESILPMVASQPNTVKHELVSTPIACC